MMAQRKWNLGDIRAPEREARPRPRPVQDVRAPEPPRHNEYRMKNEEYDEALPPSAHDHEARAHRHMPPRRKKRVVFFGGIVLLLAVVGFGASFFFRGAELTVYPKSKHITVSAAFTAYQKPENGALGYELLTLDETGERTVAATGSEDVEERATGDITLYNTFSTEPQRLIKNTRFESPDGLIFRISDSVVIPGYTEKAGGEKVPGTTTAQVFADAAGEKYNIAPARFSLPGLKDTPQFDTIYAESKSPLQGGFVGTTLIVNNDELVKTQETIHAELTDKLLARLQTERPAGLEFYENAAQVRFESLPSIDAGAGQATIRERAILAVPLFVGTDLARYLAQNTIVGYNGEAVRIENAQALSFSYATQDGRDSATSTERVDFTLSGEARIIWVYDTEKLRGDVSGATKTELPEILLEYQPAIERATALLRPFWRQSFPTDPTKIKIVEVLAVPSE